MKSHFISEGKEKHIHGPKNFLSSQALEQRNNKPVGFLNSREGQRHNKCSGYGTYIYHPS